MRRPFLPIRLRKLIGLILLLGLIFFYALGIMLIAVSNWSWAPENQFWTFIFYLVTGLIWTVPAAVIIWWMQRPD